MKKRILEFVKDKMQCGIRHSSFTGNKIKKVAVLGAGSFAISNAIQAGADA
jgi:hypothetical protein